MTEDVCDPCEWLPSEDRALVVGENGHAPAELLVGRQGQWRLCRECAELPLFNLFKKRVEVRR